jgi:hypothetical protein
MTSSFPLQASASPRYCCAALAPLGAQPQAPSGLPTL